ncbi:hypothetical protein ACIQOF_38730 [Streptomyces sp. NPDC091265]|uniref:hypothetical protein n=1 Tax=unclassified Streptomyces TaxID=2593676 RepID=UPI003450C53C
MPFTWKIPPWDRNEDCTYLATTVTVVGGGEVALNTESVRGDNATEALADLLMGPRGAGGALLLPGLVGVVVRRGIDIMWMAQPPIEVSQTPKGERTIAVDGGEAEVTAFSAPDVIELHARLHAAYRGPVGGA